MVTADARNWLPGRAQSAADPEVNCLAVSRRTCLCFSSKSCRYAYQRDLFVGGASAAAFHLGYILHYPLPVCAFDCVFYRPL